MSLRIPCPNCGPRSVHEFVHGEIRRAPEHLTDPDERDLDLAFMHDNVEGVVAERWFHAMGCRRWFEIRRDTTTDRILGADDAERQQRRQERSESSGGSGQA